MLSWGFATEGCVCARGPHVATNRVKGLKKTKGLLEKGHCHAGERTDCGPSRSWIREMLLSETLRHWASGFPQETPPAAEAAITSCSDVISSAAKGRAGGLVQKKGRMHWRH